MTWSEIIYSLEKQTEPVTAKTIGAAPATLCAMSRRGLIKVTDSSPKKYSVTNLAAKWLGVRKYVSERKIEYFALREPQNKLAMLCQFKGNDIFDAFDNPYTLTSETKLFDWIDGKPKTWEIGEDWR